MNEEARRAVDALKRDIAAFADPGEVAATEIGSQWHRISWSHGGRPRRADFLIDEGSTAIPQKVKYLGAETSYSGFLAGPHMADLLGVARVTAGNPALVGAGEDYVPLRGQSEASEEGDWNEPVPAEPLISRLVSQSFNQTQVIFMSADAGVGKTTLLREAVRRKAIEYTEGANSHLWLYVDAQGSRLAQLDQAIAAAIDDVRGRFPYHAAIPLAWRFHGDLSSSRVKTEEGCSDLR